MAEDCRRVTIDWKLPLVVLVAWTVTAIWFASAITRDVEANTEFRKAAAPRIERMDTTLQRVDKNVEKLLDGARAQ